MKSIEEVSAWIQSRQSLFPAQMQESASIPDEDIWKLLENANYAPSHKRTEPWRYVVFSGQGKKRFIQSNNFNFYSFKTRAYTRIGKDKKA